MNTERRAALDSIDGVYAHLKSLGPSRCHPTYLTDLTDARTAVAELIEIAQEVADDFPELREYGERLRTALARVKGDD